MVFSEKSINELLKSVNKIYNSSLIKTGIWSIIGTFLIKAVNLISIPIFSRLLNTAEYGEVNLFMTYATVLTIFLGLDFNGIVSKGSIDYKEEKHSYEATCLTFTGIFALTIFIICNTWSGLICNIIQLNIFELNFLLLYGYGTFVISYYSADCIFQFRYKKNTVISLFVAISNLFVSIFLILTVFKTNKYYGRIIGAIVPTTIIAFVLFIDILRKNKRKFRGTYILYSLKYSIPLIPHHLSGIIISQSDKIMIRYLVGKEENGIYSLIYNLGWLLSVLVDALNNVWMPWLFRKLKKGETVIIKQASVIYLCGFTLVSIMMEALSPEIIKIISPKNYWEGIDFVIWIVFASYIVFLYYFYTNIEIYLGESRLVSFSTTIAAVINVGLNFWGLTKYGYGFAALSTVISFSALFAFHFIITTYILKKKIVHNRMVVLFFTIMMVYSFVMQRFLYSIIARIGIGICLCILIILYVLQKANKRVI